MNRLCKVYKIVDKNGQKFYTTIRKIMLEITHVIVYNNTCVTAQLLLLCSQGCAQMSDGA